MKNPISGLNKIFDNRIRLGVMSMLMVNEEISFNDLKGMLEVTDGNLATHLVTLEENGFIKERPIPPTRLPKWENAILKNISKH